MLRSVWQCDKCGAIYDDRPPECTNCMMVVNETNCSPCKHYNGRENKCNHSLFDLDVIKLCGRFERKIDE